MYHTISSSLPPINLCSQEFGGINWYLAEVINFKVTCCRKSVSLIVLRYRKISLTIFVLNIGTS